jgi:hypothetical protein
MSAMHGKFDRRQNVVRSDFVSQRRGILRVDVELSQSPSAAGRPKRAVGDRWAWCATIELYGKAPAEPRDPKPGGFRHRFAGGPTVKKERLDLLGWQRAQT